MNQVRSEPVQPSLLPVALPVVLWILIFGQLFLSAVILFDFAWLWHDRNLNPAEWSHFYEFPQWSTPSLADLLLGVLIMPICGFGMVRRRPWAPTTFSVWLIVSMAFNALKPHYYINLFWFPSVAPLIFVAFFYIIYQNWAARSSQRQVSSGWSYFRIAAATHRFLAAACALFVTFIATALFGLLIGIILLAFPKHLAGYAAGPGFALIYLFAAVSIRYLAINALYDADDPAPLQVLGGIRLGSFPNAIVFGTGATWPFAKLSASGDGIRVQSPFGDKAWARADPRLLVRKASLGVWSIGVDNPGGQDRVHFFAPPWRNKSIEQKLKELGYVGR